MEVEIGDYVDGSVCGSRSGSIGVDGFWWVCDLHWVMGVLICKGYG